MPAVIDTTRAARAREIYDAALSAPDESAEWKALEAKRDALLNDAGEYWSAQNSGVPGSNAPHPASYGADLPMRGIGTLPLYPTEAQNRAFRRKAIALWPEPKREKFRSPVSGKVVKDAKVKIKKTSPHPDSAYAHLPLRGMGLDGGNPVRKWTLTADEKRTLAARPIRYVSTSH